MVKDDKRGHRAWWWVLPAAAGLALVAAAVLMALGGRTPSANAQAGCILEVTKAADVGIAPEGADITYTITVKNAGTVQCTTVAVVDDLVDDLDCISTTQNADFAVTAGDCALAAGAPVHWTAATLDVNETGTLTMVARLGTGATDGETVANTADATAAAGSTPDSASDDVVINDCDLTISKDSDDDEVGEGGEIVYTIDIENVGTVDCGDVVITEDIPNDTDCVGTDVIEDNSDVDIDDADGCDASGSVTWEVTEGTLDGLEPGDEAEVEITVELTSGAEDGDNIDNEACVTSDDTDANADICDTLSVDVEGVAATSTPVATATTVAVPTATPRPVVPVAPPVVAPAPPAPSTTLIAPLTGSGAESGAGGSLPLALALGLAGGCLLLLGGVAMLRRPR